jgi:hypothetical protein
VESLVSVMVATLVVGELERLVDLDFGPGPPTQDISKADIVTNEALPTSRVT